VLGDGLRVVPVFVAVRHYDGQWKTSRPRLTVKTVVSLSHVKQFHLMAIFCLFLFKHRYARNVSSRHHLKRQKSVAHFTKVG
jgi:hypothetical protein